VLQFRQIDYNSDIQEIVLLIKKNLDTNFSENIFYWKHIKNPFGRSFGLLALDKNKIVGLRMFMRWEFLDENSNVTKAIRPVDTVTDVHYRGKGLFKKLTLEGLEEFKDFFQIIFNTPNRNSLPGYLKMGWKLQPLIYGFQIGISAPIGKTISFQLVDSIKVDNQKNILAGTNRTSSYFSWRYTSGSYLIANFRDGCYLVFRKINYKSIPAILLYEIVNPMDSVNVYIKSIAKKYNRFLVYYYKSGNIKPDGKIMNLKVKNPVIVHKEDQKDIMRKIQFSLGDLEAIL